MKLFFLFIGLLSLLFFNNRAIITSGKNYPDVNFADDSCCFETGRCQGIWSFEKTESNIFNLNDQRASQSKKKLTVTNYTSPVLSGIIFTTHNGFKLMIGSKRNLFLLYHFTQSLWQLFLQWFQVWNLPDTNSRNRLKSAFKILIYYKYGEGLFCRLLSKISYKHYEFKLFCYSCSAFDVCNRFFRGHNHLDYQMVLNAPWSKKHISQFDSSASHFFATGHR